jgi:hypothetical protein
MATITTDTYLDDGTARTAAEAWTLNGGVLTIRTDTRWHVGAPAGMTGSIGNQNISATLGGGVIYDGTKVRRLLYTSGTGTVPAIGTTVTQGGTSAYLLGVWANDTSAPTAVGAAMPSSGIIKFREVTGTFAAGALTGIGATASGADVVGWIEIAMQQARTVTVPRLGFHRIRGAWLSLGTTTGSAGQILQVPTNGGGSNTFSPGCWIETGVGTDVYEFYPGLTTTAGFNTTNLGTDVRSKFVHSIDNGQMRIGNDGTTNVGYVPSAGRRIRIPNVLLRQTASGADSVNTFPNATVGSRPDWTTTSAGDIDFEFAYGDWYFLFAQPFRTKIHNCATFDGYNISESASPLDLSNCGAGMYALADIPTLSLSSCFSGGTITGCNLQRASIGSNDHSISMSYCIGQTVTDTISGIVGYARSSGRPLYVNQSSGVTIDGFHALNGYISVNTSFDIKVSNVDYCDRYVGTTNTTSGSYVVYVSNSCDGVTVDGVTFGFGGTIADVHPYAGVFYAAASNNLKFRRAGTMTSFLSGGSANNPQYIFNSGGNNVNVKISNCFVSPLRTRTLNTVNSDKNMYYDSVHGDYAGAVLIASLNGYFRSGNGAHTTTGQSAVYGTHFMDMFTSDTTGRVALALNEPTAETARYVTTSFGAKSGFTSAGGLSMVNVDDYVIVEMPYKAYGHTGFADLAPVVTGTNTGNHTYEYQYHDGFWWNGTWKTLDDTNLSGETVNQADGFKLMIRITCTVANAANLVSYVSVQTTSTLSAQQTYLQPIATPKYGYTDVVDNSICAIYAADGTFLSGEYKYLTDAFALPPWNESDYSAYMRLRAPGYPGVESSVTVTESDLSNVSTQSAWGAAIPATDPGAMGITITYHGGSPVTWNDKTFSITVTTTDDGLTAAQVAHYISWNTSFKTPLDGIRGVSWPMMVVPYETSGYRTLRGRLMGTGAAALKGVRVVRNDGTTPVPGFERMQADDGTDWIYPVPITIPNIVDGARVWIYDITHDTLVDNSVVSGGNGYSTRMAYSENTDIDIRVRANGKLCMDILATVDENGFSTPDELEDDDVYLSNAIDGSTVTGISFTEDGVSSGIDSIDLDRTYDTVTVQEIYAWMHYFMTTETGIGTRDHYWHAIDRSNYTSPDDLKIRNIKVSPSIATTVTDGYIQSDDATQSIIASSWLQTVQGRGFVAGGEAQTQKLTFDSKVTIKLDSGNTGAAYPTGTSTKPVDNLSDALAVATANGIKTIDIDQSDSGSTILALTTDTPGYEFRRKSGTNIVIVASGSYSTDRCTFEEVALAGGIKEGEIAARTCRIVGLQNIAGVFLQCQISGTISVRGSDNGTIFSDSMTIGPATLNCQSDAAVSISFTRFCGDLTITNLVAGATIFVEMAAAKVTVAANCTGGTVVVRGAGCGNNIVDGSGGAVTIDSSGLAGMTTAEQASVGKIDTMKLTTDLIPGLL